MHVDSDDNGLGTIIYLKHKLPTVATGVEMRHAELVVASGRKGGRLAHIQTYSPNHVVAVQMDFRNCAHGNVAAQDDSRIDGVSQLR
eukprot:2857059-Pleurochrysis_carterae.AAC.1